MFGMPKSAEDALSRLDGAGRKLDRVERSLAISRGHVQGRPYDLLGQLCVFVDTVRHSLALTGAEHAQGQAQVFAEVHKESLAAAATHDLAAQYLLQRAGVELADNTSVADTDVE